MSNANNKQNIIGKRPNTAKILNLVLNTEKTTQTPSFGKMSGPSATAEHEKLCRLCCESTHSSLDIFPSSASDTDLLMIIEKYLQFMPDVNDFSIVICHLCANQLKEFDQYFVKVQNAQEEYKHREEQALIIEIPFEDGTENSLESLSSPNREQSPVATFQAIQSNGRQTRSRTIRASAKRSAYGVHVETAQVDAIEDSIEERGDLVQEETQSERPLRKRRSRPRAANAKRKGQQADNIPEKRLPKEPPTPLPSPKTKSSAKKNRDLPFHDIDEGESDNEFPARDSDNDDWPAHATVSKFPSRILENGLLLVKGKKLMTMICKFFKLECALCTNEKIRFKQLRQLFEHYSAQHHEEGYVTCCQTKLSRYPAIIMHMARHLQPSAFKCEICGYMVTRPRFLESHKQTHLPEDQKPFACDQCPRRFCWKGALQIHLISHQPPEKRKLYVCHVCGKVYDTPGGLSTHKKLAHSDNRKHESHVCHICAKSFSTRTGLNEHMTTIHQPRERDQVQCTECGKWLMNNRCLKSHMILHSTVTYDCRICDYSTKKQMLLRRHLLTQHSNEKPFSCDTCGKSFKLKRALTVHVAQHNSTKSFKCTFCERVFASSTNFYTHRKNMHPKELQAMREHDLEEQRQKRIKAGVERATIVDMSATDDSIQIEESLLIAVGDDNNGDAITQATVQIDETQTMIINIGHNSIHTLISQL